MQPFPRDTSYAHIPLAIQQVINASAKRLFQAPVTEPALTVLVTLSHTPKGLLDVLCDGIAYQVKEGNIYIWFQESDRIDTAGYYRLVRFEYVGIPASRKNLKKVVKFTLSAHQKL